MVALGLTGFLAGSLGFAGASMLATTMPDPPGDTPSPQFAVVLLVIALVVTATGLGVALSARWGPAARVVGWILVLMGFGGLVYFLGASLVVAGAFPDILVQPDNLTAGVWLALTGLTGIGLIQQWRRGSDRDIAGLHWLARSSPMLVGVLLGILIGAIWYSVIYPVIPYECCFQ